MINQGKRFDATYYIISLRVVCHPIGTEHSILTQPMTLPMLPHAIFSTLQGKQIDTQKPTLQRAKNANTHVTTFIAMPIQTYSIQHFIFIRCAPYFLFKQTTEMLCVFKA
jgi:hypothetical protein